MQEKYEEELSQKEMKIEEMSKNQAQMEERLQFEIMHLKTELEK